MAEAQLAVVKDMIAALTAFPGGAAARLIVSVKMASRIYIFGVGRCGLVMRTFAVRLAQLGLPVSVVGDAVTLAASPGDLLLVGSGSGRTATALTIATRAREEGVTVLALTGDGKAPLAQDADEVIVLPGGNKFGPATLQPPGSLFEQMLFCLLEETVLLLARELDPDCIRIRQRHATLE